MKPEALAEPDLPLPPGYAWSRDAGALSVRDTRKPRQGPLLADWTGMELRARISAGRAQPLSRAVGLHRRPDVQIFDATAGLGRDAATLAGLGAEVTACERSAVLFELLRDAHRRAGELAARIRLLLADSRDVEIPPGSVIYLDPMYPQSPKTALPGLEMQYLRDLLGHDADFRSDWERHWRQLPHRRVVKRPPRGAAVRLGQPDHSLTGKRAVFDVYEPGNHL